MLIDGIFASEAIDSSGEILDVKGADITDFEEGRGVLNFEHRGDDAPGASPNDIVGRVVYAVKIYKETDCTSERERKYWKQIELPFIYGIIRLHDGAMHPGAVAAAAHFRDYHANKEDALGRYSIEGSTLSRGDGGESNRLTHTVCRRVAYTFKPCNKSADSGMLIDPNAPAGFSKDPTAKSKDTLASLAEVSKKERQHPGYTRIGEGPTFTKYEPMDLTKTTTAGSYNVSPGSLHGGSALQVEDAGLRRKLHLNMAKAAVRDWDGSGSFKPFLKNRLPDADPDFVDKFAQMVDEYKLKKKEPTLPEPEVDEDAIPKIDKNRPLSIRGKSVLATPTVAKPHFDEQAGILRTPKGSIPMYIPGRDPQPGAREAFHNSLNDPQTTKIHNYAIQNWSRVHNLLKTGKLPDAVLMHATLFSQLSPNTPVPTQELMYGHLVDAMKATGIDARDPRFATIKRNWTKRDSPTTWPQTGGNHYERIESQLRLKNTSKDSGRKVGEIGSFMLANNKFNNMAEYHKLHTKLADIIKRHGSDARAGVNELMQHKMEGKKWESRRKAASKKGMPDQGDYSGPVVRGLAPKTARYLYGMLGGGNVVVPDTHFIRHLFGLEKGTGHTMDGLDNHTIDYLKTVLWKPSNSHVLEGIDRYYANNHDAVEHLANHPSMAGFQGNREDLTFPAFWKHWMSIVPHEAARGMGTAGTNEYTDHKPFWDTIAEHIDNGIGLSKHDQEAYSRAQDAVKEHLHWQETLGEVPAMMLYWAYLVPHLLGEDRPEQEGLDMTDTPNGEVDPTVKFEKWSIDLRISLEDLLKAEAEQAKPAPMAPQPIAFRGKKVIPGHLQTMPSETGEVKDHLVLGHDAKHFFTVEGHPAGFQDFQPHEIQKINKAGLGQSYQIHKWPEFLDSGATVDAKYHGDPAFNQTPTHEKLIHGLDMDKGEFNNSDAQPGVSHHMNHWRKHPNGHALYIKGEGVIHSHMNMEASASNEAAYHNVARDVFGMEHYVPPVSVFHNPKTGARMSAIGKVEGGQHHQSYLKHHKEIISNMTASGDLHKLGMMDFVMGHSDRHSGNYLMTPHGDAQMQLIDNSAILPSHKDHFFEPPDFMDDPVSLETPVHDNQQDWAMKLDPEKLTESLTKMNYPPAVVHSALDRLNFLKSTIHHLRTNGTQMKAKDLFDPREEQDSSDQPW